MTIENVVNYVTHTPHNTNKAILIGMLKELILSYGGQINGETVKVVYDGGIET